LKGLLSALLPHLLAAADLVAVEIRDGGGYGGGRDGGYGGGGGGYDSPRPRRQRPDPSTAIPVSGPVKWFDETKGFGFVQSNDGGKDVFVHISILGPSGLNRLLEGQPVTMQVVDTAKGREALSINLA